MKVFLAGGTGQIGRELQRSLQTAGFGVLAPDRQELDLAQLTTVRPVIETHRPDVIINAAAYTQVDQAEIDCDLAYAVNAAAPAEMAKAARSLDIPLIQLSTDYVFDGQRGIPYQVGDRPAPLGVYGASKLAGERAVQHYCEAHIILRTAWVYGLAGGQNFVKTMLKLGTAREELRVVYDQVGSPTWARDVAARVQALLSHLSPEAFGIYHYTSSGVTSWYDFAIAIFEEAAWLGWPLRVQQVRPITTADYGALAPRPAYSVLACEKLSRLLGQQGPQWRQALRRMLAELYYQGHESIDSGRG